MKVGLVIKDQRPEFGGAFTFQAELLRAFSKLRAQSRHEFFVLCPTARIASTARAQIEAGAAKISMYVDPPPKRTGLKGAVVRRLLREPAFAPPLGTQQRIEQVAREDGIEFIWNVSHGDAGFDIPYMTVVWDLEHRRVPWFPELSADGIWEARELAYSRDLPRASFVITGTQVGKQEIERYYQVNAERIRVLPHPTPSLGERAAGEVALPFQTSGRPFVFYPAQFWPHKNQANLVRAIVELRASGLDIDLALVGSDKGNHAYVQELTKQLGISERVHFLGFVDDTVLATLYKKALALTYVSFCGPENLPPLEAFSLRCPVVAADIPGAREQLGDAAVFIDPANPAGIAAGIRKIHGEQALRERLLAKGAERAAKWTPRDFVRGVFNILDEFEAVRGAWR